MWLRKSVLGKLFIERKSKIDFGAESRHLPTGRLARPSGGMPLQIRWRHDGAWWQNACRPENRKRCSTPEGIETGITGRCGSVQRARPGAQRPRASRRGSPGSPGTVRGGSLCSTPEGIETGITCERCGCRAGLHVLNARGHRDGDHGLAPWRGLPAFQVLNARGHRDGDHVGKAQA